MSTKKWVVVFSFLLFISYFSFTQAQRGCCSYHGGVCGCDTSTGSQQCCDGTDSPSCTCQYIPPKPAPAPVKTITPKPEPVSTLAPATIATPATVIPEKTTENKTEPICPSNNDEYPTFVTLLFLSSAFVNFILAIIAFVYYRKSKNLSKNILP